MQPFRRTARAALLVIGSSVSTTACGSAGASSDAPGEVTRTTVVGAVVSRLGRHSQEPGALVTTGVRLVIAGHADTPDVATVAPLLGVLQPYVEKNAMSVTSYARQAKANQLDGLGPQVTVEMRDPRFKVVELALPWVVRGTHVNLSPELCPTPGQQFVSVNAIQGVYVCYPLVVPPKGPTGKTKQGK